MMTGHSNSGHSKGPGVKSWRPVHSKFQSVTIVLSQPYDNDDACHVTHVISHHPTPPHLDAQVHMQLARIHERNKKIPLAVKAYEACARKFPESKKVWIAFLTFLYQRPGMSWRRFSFISEMQIQINRMK